MPGHSFHLRPGYWNPSHCVGFIPRAVWSLFFWLEPRAAAKGKDNEEDL